MSYSMPFESDATQTAQTVNPSRGDSDNLKKTSSLNFQDLSEHIHFSPEDGRIWLDGQRMILLHNSSLGSLRHELIEKLGIEQARGLLTRSGYSSGVRDAKLVRDRWPNAEPETIFYAGTQLHSLEGLVQVETVHFTFDAQKGIYDGEFLWHHSSEDDEHIATYGIGSEPACWMQLGYAMGYVTTLLGRLTVFREVECRSMGHSTCRVIGRTIELWDDVEEDLRYLNAEDFVSHRNMQQPSSINPSAFNRIPPILGDRQLIGISSAFTAACHMLRRVANTRATVLFTGESGVGKELFARMLHEIGAQKYNPFIAINCAAIPESLIESELFGVERGAFTGATTSRQGRFERANGGTIFLDEIGTLSLTSQGKLLRALQEGIIERVGGTKLIKLVVRVVAATNIDLRKAVADGEFREDLYYRLNVYPIKLPPLRERRDDIPLLMSHFLEHYNRLHNRTATGFTLKAMRSLLHYRFPGNIRELQNLVERGVIASEDNAPIDLFHLFRDEESINDLLLTLNAEGELCEETNESVLEQFQRFVSVSSDASLSLDKLEALLVSEAVSKSKGNLSAAARLLGLTRSRLAYRMKKINALKTT